ncbi:MAG: MoxR family ATPase [bacterium]
MAQLPPPPKIAPAPVPLCDSQIHRHPGPPREGVPSLDPHYVFRPEMVAEIVWSVWPHDDGRPMSVLLVGPKGSGKTSLVEQIAARANQPLARVNLNVGTSVRHLKGRTAVADGETYFVPGVVTDAMETGKWLLLDEISGATPPVALALFPVLEPTGSVYLEDAEPPRYAVRHPGFRIFMTDNTIGEGQEESRFGYAGTNQMNAALLDRVDTTIQVGYCDPAAELKILSAKAPGIDQVVGQGLIRVAMAVRENRDITDGFSTRMLVAWGRRIAAGRINAAGFVDVDQRNPARVKEAAEAAFLRKCRSRVDADAIRECIQRVFGD